MLNEPLSNSDADRLARECIKAGRWSFARHAIQALLADRKTDQDALRVARSGRTIRCEQTPEGEWRYRMLGSGMDVIVAFQVEADAVSIRFITVFISNKR